MNKHKVETGESIHLNHAKGKPTRAQANAAKSWLTNNETNTVVEFIIELGNRGFPLSHRRLKAHVDEILQAHLGSEFRPEGVGKRWTNRFIEKHADRIVMAWAAPLEEKRGSAVNPNTHHAWFKILHETMEKYNIVEELTYGTDEIGVTGTSGQHERVMGGAHQGPHYQQIGGSRENTTVIVTICADGTGTAPAVIFKGKAYQIKWRQQNPANAQ